MSALLKSMLRIFGRGTPEPSIAVWGEKGQEQSAWPRRVSPWRATSICKETSYFFCVPRPWSSQSLLPRALSPPLSAC